MKTSILVKLGFSLVYASLTYSSPAPFYNDCNCTDWDVACWDACLSKDGDSHNQQFSLKKDDPCGLIKACIERQHKHGYCNGLPTYLPERCESPPTTTPKDRGLIDWCIERPTSSLCKGSTPIPPTNQPPSKY